MRFLREDQDCYGFLYAELPKELPPPPGEPGIECKPGHIAIEMVPEQRKVGMLHLPEELSAQWRCDAGYVLSSGVPEIKEKEIVLVGYGHGLRVRDYYNEVYDSKKRAVEFLGDDKASGRVVFTGCCGGEMISDEYGHPDFVCTPVPYWESVLAVRRQDEWAPTGSNVRIRLRPVQSYGQIELARRRYEPECEVVALGPEAESKYGVTLGEHVFDEGGIRRFVSSDEAIAFGFAIHAKVLR